MRVRERERERRGQPLESELELELELPQVAQVAWVPRLHLGQSRSNHWVVVVPLVDQFA